MYNYPNTSMAVAESYGKMVLLSVRVVRTVYVLLYMMSRRTNGRVVQPKVGAALRQGGCVCVHPLAPLVRIPHERRELRGNALARDSKLP